MNSPSLTFHPTPHLPRELTLRLCPGFGLCAWLYLGPQFTFSASYAGADMLDCRLDVEAHRAFLWVGRACFELTPTEADRVRKTFAPHGLRIVTATEFLCADANSLSSAKQTAIAAFSPPQNGERGTGVPTVVENSGTTLGLSDCDIARVLTSHEGY